MENLEANAQRSPISQETEIEERRCRGVREGSPDSLALYHEVRVACTRLALPHCKAHHCQWVALFNLKIPSRFAPVSSGCDKALQTPPDVSLEAGAWIVGDETEIEQKWGSWSLKQIIN